MNHDGDNGFDYLSLNGFMLKATSQYFMRQGDFAMGEFGEKLVKLRSESKLTLIEICEQAGIPPSRLVELERSVRIPTSGQIERLEKFYKVNSGELADLAKSFYKF